MPEILHGHFVLFDTMMSRIAFVMIRLAKQGHSVSHCHSIFFWLRSPWHPMEFFCEDLNSPIEERTTASLHEGSPKWADTPFHSFPEDARQKADAPNSWSLPLLDTKNNINLPIEPWPSHLHHQTPRTLIHLLSFLFAKPTLRDCLRVTATLQAQQILEQQKGPPLSPPFTALGLPLRDHCRKRKSSEWLTKLFN